MVLLAVGMVADVTETRNVIPSLEFKTCMTISLNLKLQIEYRYLAKPFVQNGLEGLQNYFLIKFFKILLCLKIPSPSHQS